ncbi:unnamed protein product [Phyllotreta striolata]|uniref:C2H2-type domain-containing protein n=1 Tax=Phyllotreta striolata TaxID=444603 RepID=A0A9N9XN67_PHYSR|nr:unnamed protein product [Phyllotreta striolata]
MKQSKKTKRPLQTSLGKAPCQNDKEEIDVSHVRKPIETSIYGIQQVLLLLETATDEVKSYINYECDIMYECRICRSIFRSLANFILHKRNYCKEKFKPYMNDGRDGSSLKVLHLPKPFEERKIDSNSTPESSGLGNEEQVSKLNKLNPVIEKLKEKQEIIQLTQELLTADLSKQAPKDTEETSTVLENDLLLEKIASNNAAVFQTVLRSMPQGENSKPQLMKKEVMEIHGILDTNEAVLGPDGKVCNFQTNKLRSSNPHIPKNSIVCSECNIKFSTKKTLAYHLKKKHNNTRLVHICPDCKDSFSSAWCVYRHLYKVHRKTVAQVKKLREQIHNGVIRKDEDTSKKGEKKEATTLEKTDEENQWLNNIEGDNDLQMCGGCGRRFERKAALHSHAAMCSKRLAVCNNIKENNAKKKEEESKDNKSKAASSNKSDKSPDPVESLPKGASRRKPYLLRTYKQLPSEPEIACKEEPRDSPEKDVCEDKNEEIDRKSIACDKSVSKIEFIEVDPEENAFDACEVDGGSSNAGCDLGINSECSNNNEESFGRHFENYRSSVDDAMLKTFEEKTRELIQKGIFLSRQSQECHNSDELDLICEKLDNSIKIEEIDELSNSSFNGSAKSCEQYKSPGKISIKSLDELRGFKNTNEKCLDEEISMPVLEPSVSPRGNRKSSRRLAKRKRTASLDCERTRKAIKRFNFDVLLDKEDLNFMAKASPYMDRVTLTCKSCKLQHSSLSKLLWHMSAHFSWFRFQCSRCSFVSFGKSECSSHAKQTHDIKNNEISSIVLPIPNWKTMLMSNEFKELQNADDFGGKLTDEVKPCCQDEDFLKNNNDNETTKNVMSTLFVDSEANSDSVSSNETTLFPISKTNGAVSIKNESIDITENEQENFQLEVPQEIYTLDVFEVVNIDESNSRLPVVKTEDTDFLEADSSTTVPETAVKLECEEFPNNSTNGRPTRNRMRSIKTLQNDFFYDLDRVTKQSETVSKTNGPLKKKKHCSSTTNVSHRKSKEMRVYAKK